MKKLLLVAAMALGSIGFVQAQEIDFGVQAGLNIATLSGDDADDGDIESRIGINVGVTGEYMFNQSIGLQIGAIYSQQGLTSDIEGVDSTFKLDYVNVPVLAKFYIAESGFSFDLGPQIGFLVNDEVDVDGTEIDFDNLGIDTNGTDFGAVGGLNYKFKEGTTLEGASFGVRYLLGFSEVFDDSDLKNAVFSFNLGYKF